MVETKITILGCGTSCGVPMIGKGFGLCDAGNYKNIRKRCAIVIETTRCRVLVDAGPDIRQQLIEYGKTDFDALFLTHAHADHVHGLDDIRWLCTAMQSRLKTYATKQTANLLKYRFKYIFDQRPAGYTGYYNYFLKIIEIKQKILLKKHTFIPIKQQHGKVETLGFRLNDFAYCTDVVDFEAAEFSKLRGIKVWIVDCLRRTEHKTHAHLAKVMAWIRQIKPDITYLTHMDNSMDYDTLAQDLPPNIRPAYDGLVIHIP